MGIGKTKKNNKLRNKTKAGVYLRRILSTSWILLVLLNPRPVVIASWIPFFPQASGPSEMEQLKAARELKRLSGSLELQNTIRNTNISYFNGMGLHSQNFDQVVLFQPHVLDGLKAQYDYVARDYELHEVHGLGSSNTKDEYVKKVQGISTALIQHLVDYQISERVRRASERSQEMETVYQVQQTMQGRSFVQTDHSELGGRASVYSQRGSVWLKTYGLLTTVDFSLAKNLSLGAGAPADPYQLTVQRRFTFDIDARLSYGGASAVTVASLSKEVARGLRAEVLSYQNLPGENPKQEVFQFIYSLNF